MINKEELFNSAFLKEFKNETELSNFLKELHSKALEKILKGELDVHLGYDKHQKCNGTNACNGTSKKTVKTEYGQPEVAIPRDREGNFEPIVFSKNQSKSLSIENPGQKHYKKIVF